jgi:hypothetical protein
MHRTLASLLCRFLLLFLALVQPAYSHDTAFARHLLTRRNIEPQSLLPLENPSAAWLLAELLIALGLFSSRFGGFALDPFLSVSCDFTSPACRLDKFRSNFPFHGDLETIILAALVVFPFRSIYR